MEGKITKLDLVLEQYNEDTYPELTGKLRTPPFDVDTYAPAVMGIEEKSMRIIYSLAKVMEIHRIIHSCSVEEAEIFLKEKINACLDSEYRPIWSVMEGSFDEIQHVSNDTYVVLRDKKRCPDGLDGACIGFDSQSLCMIYSQSKAIQILVDRDGMTWDVAQEYLEFNTFQQSDPKQYQPIWCDDEMLQNFSEDDLAIEKLMYVAVFKEEDEDELDMKSTLERLTIWESLDALYDYYEVPVEWRSGQEIKNSKRVTWKLGDFMPFKILFIKRVVLNN